jgi:hypothetical protein
MGQHRNCTGWASGKRRLTAILLGIGLTASLMAGACTNGAPVSAKEEGPRRIPQRVVQSISVAPTGRRVDMATPTFSDPTNITNPLFPVSHQESVLLLGKVDDKKFRTEVTLLPDTRIIEWQGQRIETLVSQYVAYLGGRIHEVAYDLYAQADDGSVWYFGEDVFNFDDGAIVDTHGTWIAGKDGPAAMIMSAHPKVGDVYRPENIPGFVFEEVTVKSVDQKLDGPLGAINGGLLVEELHMDGVTETKTFAPGYGEFYTAGGGDVEALALAVPTDAATGAMPAALQTVSRGALDIFEAAGSKNWEEASATVKKMASAWDSYNRGAEVPKMIEPRMNRTIASLVDAVEARIVSRVQQAAIDAAQWGLDLQLRYRPAVEIDVARFDLWAAQLLVDASRGDATAVNGDLFTLDYIRDRILNNFDGRSTTRLNTLLEELQIAVDDGDLPAAADVAKQLRATTRSR